MSRTLTRRPRRPELHESAVYATGKLPVDRDAGVIRGVKVLGWESGNGRRYDPAGVDPALYEGVSVRINHTAKPGDSYQSEDVFGRLARPEKRADGIYADLEYLKAHTMAERVCEAAERMPGAYGLSHNVPRGQYDVDPRDPNLITRVHKVHCVDLVADPATTNGLSEGIRPMKRIKARDFFTGLEKSIDQAKRPAVKRLLEDMGDMGDVMVADEPEAEGDYKADLLAAVAKLLDDNSEESQGQITKIMGIMKPKKADAPAKEGEGDPPANDDKKDEEKSESLQRREAVLDLCESLGFTPTAVQRKALCGLTEDADRKALAESFKAAKGAAGTAGGAGVSDKPRSRLTTGTVTESRDADYANDSWGRATRVPAASAN